MVYNYRYGTGDFTLGIILEALSGGKWEFVWAQQWFSMTDQLQMGVRHLMLDPIYFWGKMRLCHCGTTFKWFDDVLQFIEKVSNIIITIVLGIIKLGYHGGVINYHHQEFIEP